MAKNISKNQWFKDIADNIKINTAIINNLLIITINTPTGTIAAETTLATLRNPELFETDSSNSVTNYQGFYLQTINGTLINKSPLPNNNIGFTYLILKNKQLETDFYSPEQLAEMYPDDPAYQVATDELTDETKPVVGPVEDMGVT